MKSDKKRNDAKVILIILAVVFFCVVAGAIAYSVYWNSTMTGVDCMPAIPKETLKCINSGKCYCATY